MSKYQVVEVTQGDKTRWEIEPTGTNFYSRTLCGRSYDTKEHAIDICKSMNKPPPPPPTRKVVYP